MKGGDERAAGLAALCGRYGSQADSGSAAGALPPAARWWLGGLLAVAVLGGVVWELVADGGDLAGVLLPGEGLGGLPWEALLLLGGGYVLTRLVRRYEPHTVLEPDALVVARGRAPRRVRWEEVAGVEPAQRFQLWPVAVLVDGTRLELPGVPPEVGTALAEALGRARPRPGSGSQSRTQQPPPSTTQDDDGGWDGPFRTGRGA